MARIPFENVDLDKIYDDDFTFPYGAECEDTMSREYVYVKFNAGDGAASAAAGQMLVGLDSAYDPYEVTNDPNSSTIKAVLNDPKGFAQAAFTDGKCGWAQKKGYNRQTITTDGSVAQGELLMPHATTTGAVDTHDAAAKADIGVALEDDTSTSLTAGQAFINI